MKLPVSHEFRSLCQSIWLEGKTEDQWVSIESDDMFQTDSFVGGFDSTEMEFCFSYYNESGTEFWFQLTLSQVGLVASGQIAEIDVRFAD